MSSAENHLISVLGSAINCQRRWQDLHSRLLSDLLPEPCSHLPAATAPTLSDHSDLPDHTQQQQQQAEEADDEGRAMNKEAQRRIEQRIASARAAARQPPELLRRDTERRLLAELVASCALSVAGMSFAYANALLALVAAWSTHAVLRRRHLYRGLVPGPLYTAALLLGVVAALLAALDFTAVFWDGPGYANWASVFVPATYPFFLAHLAVTSAALWKMRTALRAAAQAQLMRAGAAEAEVPPLHFALRGGRAVPVSEGEGVDDDAVVSVYDCPGYDVRLRVATQFGVSEAAVTAALDPERASGVALRSGGRVAEVAFKVPQPYAVGDNFRVRTETVGLFIARDGSDGGRAAVVTLDQRSLLEGGLGSASDAWDVAVRLLRRTTARVDGLVRLLDNSSRGAEDELSEAADNLHMEKLFHIQKSLMGLTGALEDNGRLVRRLADAGGALGLSLRQLAALDKAAAEIERSREVAGVINGNIMALMDSRVGVVGDNLNTTMMNMNAAVIAVTIPTFCASVGAMSEFNDWLGDNQFDKAIGFSVFLLGCVLVGVALFVLIRMTLKWWIR
eukprot:m51a1_g5190 hypothetical protein (565) ;mRNA; r:196124-197898